MSRHSARQNPEPAASLDIQRRGWFFACFYWIAQGIYGLFAATICCFIFSVAFSIISPVFTPLTARLATAGVVVTSMLIGIQAAYRNHRWIQRRELAKRTRIEESQLPFL